MILVSHTLIHSVKQQSYQVPAAVQPHARHQGIQALQDMGLTPKKLILKLWRQC